MDPVLLEQSNVTKCFLPEIMERLPQWTDGSIQFQSIVSDLSRLRQNPIETIVGELAIQQVIELLTAFCHYFGDPARSVKLIIFFYISWQYDKMSNIVPVDSPAPLA